ncbi:MULTISPECIES: hypothetical protein [unclassified Clostridium]|uniref:hypothetical protein n=1 Tax=unclassified Clostridium TaxID=2614128 RepID=UPI001D4884A3|nr:MULTISPECIES: hypothetical protein [unclassified Clostridium]MBN1045257.1 hypothetical protein [Clostridium botulinum]
MRKLYSRKGFDSNPNITTQSPHTGRHKKDAVDTTNDIIIGAKENRLRKAGRDPDIDKLDKNIVGDVDAITNALHEVRCKLLDGEIILNNKK